MPIGSSIAGRKYSRYFLSYANTLGFNTTWQFFSPGPSPMFYLEYEAEGAGETQLSAPLAYPPLRQGFSWNDGWNRRLFGMRFMALSPERMERYFVPFLCRQVPGAKAISVRSIVDRVEDIERAGHFAEIKDMAERVDLPSQRYACPEGAG